MADARERAGILISENGAGEGGVQMGANRHLDFIVFMPHPADGDHWALPYLGAAGIQSRPDGTCLTFHYPMFRVVVEGESLTPLLLRVARRQVDKIVAHDEFHQPEAGYRVSRIRYEQPEPEK